MTDVSDFMLTARAAATQAGYAPDAPLYVFVNVLDMAGERGIAADPLIQFFVYNLGAEPLTLTKCYYRTTGAPSRYLFMKNSGPPGELLPVTVSPGPPGLVMNFMHPKDAADVTEVFFYDALNAKHALPPSVIGELRAIAADYN